ncbi:hypothetical protein C6Q13_28260 [Burkholderia gladioli]|nr:hypothetical protein C6Q13_28260 [Burkholderia gladioli]
MTFGHGDVLRQQVEQAQMTALTLAHWKSSMPFQKKMLPTLMKMMQLLKIQTSPIVFGWFNANASAP